jgi:hypothetical protein
MNWDYSVEVLNKTDDGKGGYYPYGVKIVKTLYNDQNELVVSVDTDVEDAALNAGSAFIEEFFTTCKQVFLAQVTDMFEYSVDTGIKISGPSRATSLGMEMTKALSLGFRLVDSSSAV